MRNNTPSNLKHLTLTKKEKSSALKHGLQKAKIVLIKERYFVKRGKKLLFIQPVWGANDNGEKRVPISTKYQGTVQYIWERELGIKVIFLKDIHFKDTKLNTKITTGSKFDLVANGKFSTKFNRFREEINKDVRKKYKLGKVNVIIAVFPYQYNSFSRGKMLYRQSGFGRGFKDTIVMSTDRANVIAHEIGHCLSLGHTKEERLMRHKVPSNINRLTLIQKEKDKALYHGLETSKIVQ